MPHRRDPGFSGPTGSIIRVIDPLPNTLTPAAALAAWPAGHPLAAVWSTGDLGWAILAPPACLVRARTPAQARDLLAEIACQPTPTQPPAPDAPPFASGWIGWLSYDLGRALEPAAAGPAPPADDRRFPLAEFARCEGAYAYDRRARRWHALGNTRSLPDPRELIQAAPHSAPAFTASDPRSGTGERAYTDAVARAIDLIHAGDVYQVNLTHRLTGAFEGSARALFAALAHAADPWHGLYLESDEDTIRRAFCSASPELFLSYDPTTRRLTTRPMKGTRPISATPDELHAAPKDRAELAMIVDLMRNDLGRVAEFGSVRVETARAIETHADSVHQATATISATLRKGLTLADAIAAAFPAGSVTGAPKIRAMQLIDELEPAARGPYCGTAGFIADTGHAMLNVAIRTATVTGTPGPRALDDITTGTLDYPVGAGIVADSDPQAEWDETLVKAEILRRAIAPAPSLSPLGRGSG